MATATGRLVHLLGPARRLTGIGSASGFTTRVVIATTVRRRRRRSRRQILGSVAVVGMMTITHMLLKALWFDHAAADITDDCIERICFRTQPVQTHVGPVQSHHAALWSIRRRIAAHGLIIRGRRRRVLALVVTSMAFGRLSVLPRQLTDWNVLVVRI